MKHPKQRLRVQEKLDEHKVNEAKRFSQLSNLQQIVTRPEKAYGHHLKSKTTFEMG